MTPTVCFTGACEVNGVKIQRHLLEAACSEVGYPVVSASTCDILVASRDNTVKAGQARTRGATTMTYEEFVGELHMAGVQKIGLYDTYDLIHGAARLTAAQERQAAAERVAAKREARMKELEELESNPLFGMF